MLTEETGAEGRVERQVMVTQLTTAREVVRVILSELGLVSADPNDYYLCIIEGSALSNSSPKANIGSNRRARRAADRR